MSHADESQSPTPQAHILPETMEEGAVKLMDIVEEERKHGLKTIITATSSPDTLRRFLASCLEQSRRLDNKPVPRLLHEKRNEAMAAVWRKVAEIAQTQAKKDNTIDALGTLSLSAALYQWGQNDDMGEREHYLKTAGLQETFKTLTEWLSDSKDSLAIESNPQEWRGFNNMVVDGGWNHSANVVLEYSQLAGTKEVWRLAQPLLIQAEHGGGYLARNKHFSEEGYQAIMRNIMDPASPGSWSRADLTSTEREITHLMRTAHTRGWKLPQDITKLIAEHLRRFKGLKTSPSGTFALVDMVGLIPEATAMDDGYEMLISEKSPAYARLVALANALYYLEGEKWTQVAWTALKANYDIAPADLEQEKYLFNALHETVHDSAHTMTTEQIVSFVSSGIKEINRIGLSLAAARAQSRKGRQVRAQNQQPG